MTEATCRRELELEIPAETVKNAVERVAKEFARVARVPGFRPGKAPVTLIRRRFADDIKSEVLQSLVPEQIERAVTGSVGAHAPGDAGKGHRRNRGFLADERRPSDGHDRAPRILAGLLHRGRAARRARDERNARQDSADHCKHFGELR